MLPRKAYFEFEAQPATITPYTPMEVSARMNSRPASMLESHRLSVNGITAHAAIAGANVRIGANTNRNRLALVGTMISLSSSFNASAKGCHQPLGPTRFGPLRTCM